MFVLADPVDHVRAPTILNRHFAEAGIDVGVLPLHIAAADLAEVLTGLRRVRNLVGCGVTIPHKVAIVSLLDALTPRAQAIGAVNYVRREEDGRLTGDNVDGAGFIKGMADCDVSPGGRAVLQIGAGGAGRSIAFALAEAGASELVIYNRTSEKAEQLVQAVRAAHPACRMSSGSADPADFDIVVNTTSIGMKEADAMPFDPDRLRPEATVAEVIMMPERTAVLDAAAARGCRTVPGRKMMEGQIELLKAFLRL